MQMVLEPPFGAASKRPDRSDEGHHMQGIPDLELIKRLAMNPEAVATLRRANLISLLIISAIAVAVTIFRAVASP